MLSPSGAASDSPSFSEILSAGGVNDSLSGVRVAGLSVSFGVIHIIVDPHFRFFCPGLAINVNQSKRFSVRHPLSFHYPDPPSSPPGNCHRTSRPVPRTLTTACDGRLNSSNDPPSRALTVSWAGYFDGILMDFDNDRLANARTKLPTE